MYIYSILFAMTSKVWKKRKNFKINWKGGRFKKKTLKAEDPPLYRKTWQVCHRICILCQVKISFVPSV